MYATMKTQRKQKGRKDKNEARENNGQDEYHTNPLLPVSTLALIVEARIVLALLGVQMPLRPALLMMGALLRPTNATANARTKPGTTVKSLTLWTTLSCLALALTLLLCLLLLLLDATSRRTDTNTHILRRVWLVCGLRGSCTTARCPSSAASHKSLSGTTTVQLFSIVTAE